MLLNIILKFALAYSRPITSHHVICHVTAVTCLFIVNNRKRKGKSKEKKY